MAGLRTAISSLRKALNPLGDETGRSHISLESHRYSLTIPSDSRVDFQEFEALCTELVNELSRDAGISSRADQLIAKALDLYRGPLLPKEPFEELFAAKRESLTAQWLKLIQTCGRTLIQSRHYRRAAFLAEQGLLTDPLWSDGVAIAMEAYSSDAQVVKAMRAYRSYEALLRKELNTAPDARLQEMFEKLQQLF